jgi:hypothetical protein
MEDFIMRLGVANGQEFADAVYEEAKRIWEEEKQKGNKESE